MSKEFTYSDVSAHTTQADCYLVVHDKVYDVGSFIDEHPGGAEVILDVAGQDATEAFEDVGHSDEARDVLHGLLVGDLKRLDSDPKPKSATDQVSASRPKSAGSGTGSTGLLVLVLVGAVISYFAYQYVGANKNKS